MTDRGRKEDGRAEIAIAADAMSADCSLFPSIGGGSPITSGYIRALLDRSGINVPVDWKNIEGQIKEAEERGKRKSFMIAKGLLPTNTIPSHIKLKKRFFLAATKKEHSDVQEVGGRVDYRGVSPFTLVARGEPVAREVEELPGVPGKNVRGELVPPGMMEVMRFSPGEHLVQKNDRYFADCDGHFVCEKGIVRVSPELSIDGDIDFHSGHVTFPGDVSVRGGVKRGFHVLVKGQFSCGDTIEATKVSVTGDLDTAEGIIGYSGNIIKVGGQASAKFLENVFLEVRRDVRIKDSVFNSRVFSLDRVVLGKEGKILGGEVHGVNGVEANNIGNAIGLYGEIHVGADFVLSRKLNEYRKKIVRYTFKMETLKQLIDLGKAPEEMLGPVEQRIAELQGKIEEGYLGLDRNIDAKIIVHGDIFPGILISICSARFYVREKMSNTVFYLDENRVQFKAISGDEL